MEVERWFHASSQHHQLIIIITHMLSSPHTILCTHHRQTHRHHTRSHPMGPVRCVVPQGLLSHLRGEAFPSLFLVLLPPLPFLLEVGALNPARRSGVAHLSAILSIEIASGGNKTVLSVYLFGQSFATTGQEMSSKVVVSGVGDFLPLAHLRGILSHSRLALSPPTLEITETRCIWSLPTFATGCRVGTALIQCFPRRRCQISRGEGKASGGRKWAERAWNDNGRRGRDGRGKGRESTSSRT